MDNRYLFIDQNKYWNKDKNNIKFGKWIWFFRKKEGLIKEYAGDWWFF